MSADTVGKVRLLCGEKKMRRARQKANILGIDYYLQSTYDGTRKRNTAEYWRRDDDGIAVGGVAQIEADTCGEERTKKRG
jgi:hypothetical protein